VDEEARQCRERQWRVGRSRSPTSAGRRQLENKRGRIIAIESVDMISRCATATHASLRHSYSNHAALRHSYSSVATHAALSIRKRHYI
jgi:hypothetical protein